MTNLSTACVCLAVLALCGCRGRFSLNAGSGAAVPAQAAPGVSVSNSQISASADSALGAAILLGIIAADGAAGGSQSPGPAASPDPSRRVNLQDCSKPVDYAAGNLLCR